LFSITVRIRARNSQSKSRSHNCVSPGITVSDAIPPPDNDIDKDHSHIWMSSGGGTSIPSSVSAPQHSLDSVVSSSDEQTLQNDSKSTDMWQSGTGRGIRAHETNIGIYITF